MVGLGYASLEELSWLGANDRGVSDSLLPLMLRFKDLYDCFAHLSNGRSRGMLATIIEQLYSLVYQNRYIGLSGIVKLKYLFKTAQAI